MPRLPAGDCTPEDPHVRLRPYVNERALDLPVTVSGDPYYGIVRKTPDPESGYVSRTLADRELPSPGMLVADVGLVVLSHQGLLPTQILPDFDPLSDIRALVALSAWGRDGGSPWFVSTRLLPLRGPVGRYGYHITVERGSFRIVWNRVFETSPFMWRAAWSKLYRGRRK